MGHDTPSTSSDTHTQATHHPTDTGHNTSHHVTHGTHKTNTEDGSTKGHTQGAHATHTGDDHLPNGTHVTSTRKGKQVVHSSDEGRVMAKHRGSGQHVRKHNAFHRKPHHHRHLPLPHFHIHRLHRMNRKKDQGKKKRVDGEEGEEEVGEDVGEEDVEYLSTEKAFEKLKTSDQGLISSEAATRLQTYGKNVIEEDHVNRLLKFLTYFWNPLAGAMEVAALISLFVFDWLDFGLIIGLLFVNATIGYWEEARAGDAIAALKSQLAAKGWVRRAGSDWTEVLAEGIVPGDIINLKCGNVAPADCKLIGSSELKVDQSVLTGESLPVTKQPGATVYSGSTIKLGECAALVYATGKHTYFGRSAGLVASTHTEGHYKKLLSSFGLGLLILLMTTQISQFWIRGKRCGHFGLEGYYCPTINNLVVLIVGGVPIAMPTVLSVTMAIGAGMLAKKGAIVSRLTAVEDLAAMDFLCTDKTGTLTKNQLEMGEPHCVGKCSKEQLILDACLCSDFSSSVLDPIDKAIIEYNTDPEGLKKYAVLEFVPFDPVSKRTMAKVRSDTGETFTVAKGAPQVILDRATNKAEVEQEIESKILEYAANGYRSLGVGRMIGDLDSKDERWEMEGIIALFDPPREDTKDTIHKAMAMGITIKMLTGDQQAIAAETARRLGMGTRIMTAKQFEKDSDVQFVHDIITHDGFSQVRPEHKYQIVEKLQSRRHVVAMTGDGVNDAPALKKANVGFAVAGATEAARSASDIVMTQPGLSVMIDAIKQSRKIFERMKNYSTYTISVTVRVVLTFSILTFAYDWYFPTLMVLIIAILNDGTIMTISRDRVKAAPLPDRWNFREIFVMAALLGFWQVISTVVLFVIIKQTNFFTQSIGLHPLSDDQLRAVIYLQVSISGQATIFVTRTRGWSFLSRPANIVLAAFVIAQIIATILGGGHFDITLLDLTVPIYGFDGYPNDGGITSVYGAGWAWALAAWIWVIIWHPWMDLIKFWAQSWLFRRNIPFVHPYNEVDQRRDRMLELKSKQAHRPHRRETGDVESGQMSFQEMYEKEEEAIEAEEAKKAQEEMEMEAAKNGEVDEGESHWRRWLHKKGHVHNQELDEIEEEETTSTPTPGHWEQVWLGPTKEWYKVWVPDCYGKPVGIPIPAPEGRGYVPPLTGVTYPFGDDDVTIPSSYVRLPQTPVPSSPQLPPGGEVPSQNQAH